MDRQGDISLTPSLLNYIGSTTIFDLDLFFYRIGNCYPATKWVHEVIMPILKILFDNVAVREWQPTSSPMRSSQKGNNATCHQFRPPFVFSDRTTTSWTSLWEEVQSLQCKIGLRFHHLKTERLRELTAHSLAISFSRFIISCFRFMLTSFYIIQLCYIIIKHLRQCLEGGYSYRTTNGHRLIDWAGVLRKHDEIFHFKKKIKKFMKFVKYFKAPFWNISCDF